MARSEATERQYWLWVTRPEYYLDEDGSEREHLDPQRNPDGGDWWTCHKDTRKSDLVLLWRTRPKSDIGYLIQAGSDAYSIADDPHAARMNWDYGCAYVPLYKFRRPITIEDLRDDCRFDEWGPLRSKFRQKAYKIPVEFWQRLANLASKLDPESRAVWKLVEREPACPSILLEEELEEMLVDDLGLLKAFGYDLALYVDPETRVTGRQFVCGANRGRIDILAWDRTRKRYVVIELKNVRAGQNTFGQICSYMGWVQENIAGKTPVVGLVISRGYDAKFHSSMKTTRKLAHLDISELGLQ